MFTSERGSVALSDNVISLRCLATLLIATQPASLSFHFKLSLADLDCLQLPWRQALFLASGHLQQSCFNGVRVDPRAHICK